MIAATVLHGFDWTLRPWSQSRHGSGRPLQPAERRSGRTVLSKLANVVDQAIELPLRADLGLAPEREPVHALVVPDVGKHPAKSS